MQGRIEREFSEIEAICASIEAAVRQEDWLAATACNASLQASLRRMDKFVHLAANIASEEVLGLLAARLESVLRHHRILTLSLRDLRDEAAAELATVQTGRRAAHHYLETAGH